MKVSARQVESFAKKAFVENKGLKLLALLITLGLFVAVRAQEKVQRWVDVEVEVVYPNEKAGLVLTNKPINNVRVHIRGRRSIVNDIKNESSHLVKMDLSNRSKTGMSTFFFEPEMFNFDGVEVVDINPEAISIRTEKLESRRLPVKIKTVGRLKEGTKFEKKPTIDPETVLATGPSSVIRSVTSLSTQEVGIDSIDVGPYAEEVPLIPVDGLLYARDKFKVEFKVVQRRIQRMLTGLMVKTPAAADKAMKVIPSQVAVSLTGPQLSLDRLDPSMISPIVEVEVEGDQLAKPGKYQVPVKIEGLPEDIEVKTTVPSLVELEVLN